MISRMVSAGPFGRFVCVVLALVMATAPSAAVLAQGPSDQTLLADPAAGKIDTTYVMPGAVAIVVLRPAQMMSAPMAEMLPTEVATAAGLKYLGFDPADVDKAIAFVDRIDPAAPPGYGLTIKFNKPFRASAIPPELRAHAQLSELAGKRYLQSQNPMLPSFYGVDNRTLVVAPDATVRQLIEADDRSKTGPIIDRVRQVPAGDDFYAAVDVASLRPLIQMGMMQAAQQVPPEAQQFLEAPNLIAAAELSFNLSGRAPLSLVVHANDEAAAERLEGMIAAAMTSYQEQMKGQLAEQAMSEDPVERALAQYMERVSGRWAEPLLPEREGTSLMFFRSKADNASQQQLATIAIIGVLVALLLPAIQAAREAARRNASMNNMKQLMIALLNFHDVKGNLPAHAIYSPDGKPLLSWRVQILPYLEEQALYEQFRLDEPWDSEHNRQLIAKMPAVFHCPSSALDPAQGKTTYVAPVGEGLIFDGTENGARFAHITDGTSKTLALVEVSDDRAVIWTKPDDLQYDPQDPLAGLSGHHSGVFLAAFADAHVRAIPTSIDVETLKALFTRAGREVIDSF